MSAGLAAALARWHDVEDADAVGVLDRSFTFGDPGGRAVLVLHGAGGSPADLRALGEDLGRAGLHGVCPLLPCHGRGRKALGRLTFEGLVARAREAFDLLAAGDAPDGPPAGPPALLAQSLGAVLGIRLAIERSVSRFVALAPALEPFVLRRAVGLVALGIVRPDIARATWRWQTEVRQGIREATARLAEVTCPLLALHSTDDRSVSIRGARRLVEGVSSAERRLIPLDGQGHVLSLAPDRERVFGPVRAFLLGAQERATAEARSGTPGRPSAGA